MGAQQELPYARDWRSVRRHPEISKISALSCFLIKRCLCAFGVHSSRRCQWEVEGQGAMGMLAAGGCCALQFSRGVSGPNITSGTALCLHLYGACPDSCFFKFDEYSWQFRIKWHYIKANVQVPRCDFCKVAEEEATTLKQCDYHSERTSCFRNLLSKDLYCGKLNVATAVPVRMRHGLFITPAN